ncbi:MAG: hypothetical protein H6636_00235 [Anaerolineales bacterium]|nr:hypothetical protein [Anaerolineales bacterium]
MFTIRTAFATTTPPVLWTAGGLSAGNDGAGQAARVATDASGNVAIVSGPAFASKLAVTSYTANGTLRWQSVVSPSSGTFLGDWVAAAPNGDWVAVGHNISGSSGNPIGITLVRFGSDGMLQWRVDIAPLFPSVGRLLVDSAGNAYLAFNSLGDGQDIQLRKYSPSGGLLWSQVINTGLLSNNIATSLTLSADETEIALTGDTSGGAEWITALYATATGAPQWQVVAPEGVAALDVVMDGEHVYVTGQGNVGINTFLTVVAYDRTNGTKLWRVDKKPVDGTGAAGLRMSKAPDGSLVVAGRATRGFLDWYIVAFETTGAVRWEAVRDGGLSGDEFPRGVLVLADGTTVVTGRGGPNLPGGFIPGVTVGYSPTGALLWEAFSALETVWPTALLDGNVCATGGYDALITCWQLTSGVPTPTPTFTPTVTPTPPPANNVLHVADIAMSVVSNGSNRFHAEALVTIHDQNNQPINGVTVSGAFTGDSNSSTTGVTNSSGQVTLSSTVKKNGTNWTLCVTNATKTGFTYDPAVNIETCDSTSGNPTPTPTPVVGGTMHIGDLDGSSVPGVSGRWDVTVVITVEDSNHIPVAGVTVSGAWSNGASGSGSCVTGVSGQCSVTKTGLRSTVNSITFTVTNATHSSLTYQSTANHDPDGDSNGTMIIVNKP